MASDYSIALVSISIDNGSNYVGLPTPSDYRMTSTTIVDSARNSDGVVVGSVVRQGIRKVELSWEYLTITQFSDMAKLFENGTRTSVSGTTLTANGSFFFKAIFFDSVFGEYIRNVDMYVGDRITDTAKIKLDQNGKPIGYTGVKLSLIEV